MSSQIVLRCASSPLLSSLFFQLIRILDLWLVKLDLPEAESSPHGVFVDAGHADLSGVVVAFSED